jgi:hypothetical protein
MFGIIYMDGGFVYFVLITKSKCEPMILLVATVFQAVPAQNERGLTAGSKKTISDWIWMDVCMGP